MWRPCRKQMTSFLSLLSFHLGAGTGTWLPGLSSELLYALSHLSGFLTFHPGSPGPFGTKSYSFGFCSPPLPLKRIKLSERMAHFYQDPETMNCTEVSGTNIDGFISVFCFQSLGPLVSMLYYLLSVCSPMPG